MKDSMKDGGQNVLGWKTVKTIFVGTSAVRVNQSTKGFYTIELGRAKKGTDGELFFIRYFPMRFETKNGQITEAENVAWEDIQSAVEQARDFIRVTLQEHENTRLETKIQREESDANRGKKMSRGLRTLSREDAQKRKETENA